MSIGSEIENIRALVMAEMHLPQLEDDDYTIRKAMEDTGMSETGARDHLRKLVAAKTLRVVMKRGEHGAPVQTFVRA